MNAIFLFSLLAATGAGTLAWILWQKKLGRHWLGKWLMLVGLLCIPIVSVKLFAPPAWADILTMPAFLKYVATLPFLLAIASFCGGLVMVLAVIAGDVVDIFDLMELEGRTGESSTHSETEDYFDNDILTSNYFDISDLYSKLHYLEDCDYYKSTLEFEDD